MAVHFRCGCGQELKTGAENAGKATKCPTCGAVVQAPAVDAPGKPSGVIRFRCSCGKPLAAPAEHGGKTASCPACGATVAVPAAGRPAAAPTQAPLPVGELVPEAPPVPRGSGPPPAPPSLSVAFIPFKTIEWPDRCVRCFAQGPTHDVALHVAAATKLKRAATRPVLRKEDDLAGLAALFTGALLGPQAGIAMYMAAAGSPTPRAGKAQAKEDASAEAARPSRKRPPLARKYAVPICGPCYRRLSRDHIRALKGAKDKSRTIPPPAVTPILTRELLHGGVIVTFRNADYAEAFREANHRWVFRSVEAFRATVSRVLRRISKSKGTTTT